MNYLNGTGAASNFGPNQSANNYTYDPIGNLTNDNQAGVSNIRWTVYGKIDTLNSNNGTIAYTYDPAGQRATKTVGGVTTFYIRDAQGNTLALYDNKSNQVNWREQHLYGSSRIGMWTPNVNLANNNATTVWDTLGYKHYELITHTGNVVATVSDIRIPVSTDGTTTAYYLPVVTTAQDYYGFGGLMPGRTYTENSVYPYGFNGKENDNEVQGVGNQQDYGMRIYDPRLGRFLSVDAMSKSYPWYTPYQFAGNTVIQAIDLDGKEESHYTLTFNPSKGISVLTRTSKEELPSTNLFGETYPGGETQRAVVQFGNDTYHVGFSGDDLVNMQIFNLWKQHPNAKVFERLFPSDKERGDLEAMQLFHRSQDFFLQLITSAVPLGFTNFEPVDLRGLKGSKQINQQVKEISNGGGTPRLDKNGNPTVFENRKNTAVERKWAGAIEYEVDVPGKNNKFRILKKAVGTDSSGNTLFKYGWTDEHYKVVHDIQVKPPSE